MGAPILPPGRSTPNDLPKWLRFEPREGFGTCGCARVTGPYHYALSRCTNCHGAGIVAHPQPLLSAHEERVGACCAERRGEGDERESHEDQEQRESVHGARVFIFPSRRESAP